MSEKLTDPEVRRSDGKQGAGGTESGPRARSRHAPGPDFAEKVRRGHPHDCRCTRCTGFTSGPNGTAITRMTHGTRSMVEIQPYAQEVAEGIEQTLRDEQLWRDSFTPTVKACALVLVRLERANAALAQVDEQTETNPLVAYIRDGDPFAALRQDAARWANVARGYLNDLGLTPRSLAAIAKDTGIARSTRAATALAALTEHVEREHTGA